jgi:hypothetical protein
VDRTGQVAEVAHLLVALAASIALKSAILMEQAEAS